ncbi:MAG: sugar phosphate isomerase/epimerase [Nitrospirae bacterium]|nr:sugar phosphate isomerase/epimerase [Nitrospirota bacterium]
MEAPQAVLPAPHFHIPYEACDKYLPFFKENKWDLEIYFGSRSFDKIKKSDIIKLKKKLDYNPQLSIHGPFMDLSPGGVDPKVREITIKRFSKTLDIAEVLRPRAIVFHSGYDKWKYDARVDIWLEGCLQTWRPINKRASELGVKIAIENIFEDDPAHLGLLSKEMDSENFGICFDTGHFNLFSKIPLTEWLGIIKPYIKELHLHDNSRIADDHLAIGEGSFDFATLFKEIRGIDCVYTLEAHNVKDAMTSLERLRAYL